jgi:hypothetical protein
MKRLLSAAFSLVFALGVGTVLHADLNTPDVGIPDVQEVPDVGPSSPRDNSVPPVAQDGVTGSRSSEDWLSTLPGSSSSSSMDSFPTLSFGAGVALTFTEDADSDTFLSLYVEGYPWVLGKVLGLGFTFSYDVVPVSEGEMVIGAQADVRWVFLPMNDGGMWLDFRVGPAYQINAQSLRMYAYTDLGFDLSLGTMLLETRMGVYFTGTATGIVVSAGMEL